MDIGMIGLGRMGLNMVTRLLRGGHWVVAYDLSGDAVGAAEAEGFALMEHKAEFGLDLHQIAELWREGSVVRSWLLDLTARALAENPRLEGIAAYVADSGEGRWTVAQALELGCSVPVITLALRNRFRSREQAPFGDKLLAAMRNQVGGHAIKGEG